MADASSPHLPLLIGVTGHRDLPPDEVALRTLVASTFRALRARVPDTPFVVVSGLAEGADRLVARVAMEELDARLVAPLPCTPDEFVRDFGTEASRQQFQTLLERAHRYEVQPGGDQRPLEGEARRGQYARVGAYLVEHCHVLVALWDEAEARGTGGTGEVVQWWRCGEVPAAYALGAGRDPLSRAPARPLIVINPQRLSTRTEPAPDHPHAAWHVLERIDEYNRGITANSRTFVDAGIAASEAQLGAPPSEQARGIARAFAAADTLAVRCQSQERRIVAAVSWIYGASLLFFGLMDWLPWLVAFYVIAVPAIALLVRGARRRRLEDRALDYRALAEGLRVLYFWRASGIEEAVSASYLSRHAGVLSWIRQAVISVEVMAGPAPRSRADDPESLKTVVHQWINAQHDYFVARHKTFTARDRRCVRVVAAAFAVTFAVALAYSVFAAADVAALRHTFGALSTLSTRVRALGIDHTAFQAALGLFGAIGVATDAWARRRAYDTLARQYGLSASLFAAARERIGDARWPDRIVLTALGREALMENGEWLWLRRSQPLDLPKA